MNAIPSSTSIALDTPYKLLELSKEIIDVQSYQYSYGNRPGFTPLLVAHLVIEAIFENKHMLTLDFENSEEFIGAVFANLREKGVLSLETEATTSPGVDLSNITIYELLVSFIFEFIDLLSSLNLLIDTLLTCLSVNERTMIVLVNDYKIIEVLWNDF